MTPDFRREHHAVPAAYLRGWSDDRHEVFAYRLLVPHAKYPVWRKERIRGLLSYTHLYTSVRDGVESDALERWLNEEFEIPALEALQRVRSNEPLTPEHWKRLERYVFALDARTPGAFFEHHKRWSRQLPGMVESTLRSAVRRGRQAQDAGGSKAETKADLELATGGDPITPAAPVRVWTEKRAEGGGLLHVEVVNGRELWLHTIRHALTHTIEKVKGLTWSVLQPYRDSEWFTSDHPVVRLGFASEQQYDFGGGWGRKNCEVLVPLSPRHLLYAKVGDRDPPRGEVTREMTAMLQRFVAERADRWIIARSESVRPTMFRRRTVNREWFEAEEAMWESWHAEQRRVEDGPPSEVIRVNPPDVGGRAKGGT